jgi:hypothetical protein
VLLQIKGAQPLIRDLSNPVELGVSYTQKTEPPPNPVVKAKSENY